MLVLSRKKGETLIVGGNCVLKVLEIRGGVIRLGIEAPDEVEILRGELRANSEQAELALATE